MCLGTPGGPLFGGQVPYVFFPAAKQLDLVQNLGGGEMWYRIEINIPYPFNRSTATAQLGGAREQMHLPTCMCFFIGTRVIRPTSCRARPREVPSEVEGKGRTYSSQHGWTEGGRTDREGRREREREIPGIHGWCLPPQLAPSCVAPRRGRRAGMSGAGLRAQLPVCRHRGDPTGGLRGGHGWRGGDDTWEQHRPAIG